MLTVYSLLLGKGLIRVPRPIPPGTKFPCCASATRIAARPTAEAMLSRASLGYNRGAEIIAGWIEWPCIMIGSNKRAAEANGG
jgi:hypothetical protein